MKIYNGTIISCDRENRVHNYLVEDRGRILYAGAGLPAAYEGAPLERSGERGPASLLRGYPPALRLLRPV